MQDQILEELDAALDAESFDWLSSNQPNILHIVEKAVAKGIPADVIRRRVAERVGADRLALAVRAYQAASHLERLDIKHRG